MFIYVLSYHALQGGQGRAWHPLERSFRWVQATMWVPGIEPGSSMRAKDLAAEPPLQALKVLLGQQVAAMMIFVAILGEHL